MHSKGRQKIMLTAKRSSVTVGNPSSLYGGIASANFKKILPYKFNPALITAILTRNPKNIKPSLASTQRFHDNSNSPPPSLPHEQFKELRNNKYFSGVLSRPVLLAIKLCNTENMETTHGNDPSRYNVLHCLAEYFDALTDDAIQKCHPVPDLEEILKYARGFTDKTALNTFILGLSDENKALADKILNPNDSNTPVLR